MSEVIRAFEYLLKNESLNPDEYNKNIAIIKYVVPINPMVWVLAHDLEGRIKCKVLGNDVTLHPVLDLRTRVMFCSNVHSFKKPKLHLSVKQSSLLDK